MVEGRNRLVYVHGLVDAGAVLVGVTDGFLIGFDKGSGRTAWEIPGEYVSTRSSTAAAGNVLYFQRSPGTRSAAKPHGTLNALDLDTRAIL
jgi:outer membrane protein assembly factor BamB